MPSVVTTQRVLEYGEVPAVCVVSGKSPVQTYTLTYRLSPPWTIWCIKLGSALGIGSGFYYLMNEKSPLMNSSGQMRNIIYGIFILAAILGIVGAIGQVMLKARVDARLPFARPWLAWANQYQVLVAVGMLFCIALGCTFLATNGIEWWNVLLLVTGILLMLASRWGRLDLRRLHSGQYRLEGVSYEYARELERVNVSGTAQG